MTDDADKTQDFRRRTSVQKDLRNESALDLESIRRLAAINPLVAAANPLLLSLQTLRTASMAVDISILRSKLLEMLAAFDADCSRKHIADDQRHIASYALCTVVDEAIQSTPWGTNWAKHSLLVERWGDAWGGEKFFQLLESMLTSPSKFIDNIELFGICLSLGFQGKYQRPAQGMMNDGARDVRERTFSTIRTFRNWSGVDLSSQWRGLEVEARKFQGFGLLWLLAGLLVLVALGMYLALWYSLGSKIDAMNLNALSLPKVVMTQAAPRKEIEKPRLRDLLRKDIDDKLVDVKDYESKSVVTLIGEGNFDSGSGVPNERITPVIARVADALQKVEGEILVVGHTDNVPTRTSKFASNLELSQERARQVSKIISSTLNDPARVHSEGRGDSDPLQDVPTDTDAGRSRHRRVEILLLLR